jgi:hypothetical protein
VVIPDGTVLYEYSSMSPSEHVKNTLAALQTWHDKQQRPAISSSK